MGVRIFENDNWNRIQNGIISRKDITRLDGEKDRELIAYLIAHAPETCRGSMMKYAAENYGMEKLPARRINTDDPEDPFFWEYAVLREQAEREDDRELLKAAVLHSADHGVSAFAFCRLTGYTFPPGECDAYSYRTFACGRIPGMTAESVREFCRMIAERGGPFQDAAEECLRAQGESDQ